MGCASSKASDTVAAPATTPTPTPTPTATPAAAPAAAATTGPKAIADKAVAIPKQVLTAFLSPSVDALQTLWAGNKNKNDTTTATTSTTSTASDGQGISRAFNQGAHHLRNIFAVPLTAMTTAAQALSAAGISIGSGGDADGHHHLPVHPKSADEEEFLMQTLPGIYLFEDLSASDLYALLQAFEKITVPASGHTLITQGEPGDYFYLLYQGHVEFLVDGKSVGTADAGTAFGELALLYTAPRAATVRTTATASASTESCTLFQVDQITFRRVLQHRARSGQEEKLKLLKGVTFLQDLEPARLHQLANAMTPRPFTKGEILAEKGKEALHFYILQTGSWHVKNIAMIENVKYEDFTVGPGQWLGERAIVKGEPLIADAIAAEDGLAFCIDKETFVQVLGDLHAAILRSQDAIKLGAIKLIQDSSLDAASIRSLAALIEDRSFRSDDQIMIKGQTIEPALYFIRSGKAEITDKSGSFFSSTSQTLTEGLYFGEETLKADVPEDESWMLDLSDTRMPLQPPNKIPARYTVTVKEDCVVGVLKLSSMRSVFDTRTIGTSRQKIQDSVVQRKKQIKMSDLKRHTILGAGTFGQCWLVSRTASDGSRRAYALKVQSKYELCQSGQAAGVVNEKNIMAVMQSPFITSLVATFQDEYCIYMLMGLVQGGELYSVMHTNTRHGVKEWEGQFYIAGIAEGLGYMHRRGYVYRDLKPENVMIDSNGYPVIIDFGFAKYVVDKTYTLCGTPLYLPPEVILNRGHDWGADHWSLGVLTFEMMTGYTPFYNEGMGQSDLFRAIVKGKFTIPKTVSAEASHVIRGLLTREPSKRLGSLAGGEDDILLAPWFKPVDLHKLRMQAIPAPHIPKIKDPLDSSNFEDWSHLQDKSKIKYPALSVEESKMFESF